MKKINKFTKIILVIVLLFSQFGNAAKVLADEITNRDLDVSLEQIVDENNKVSGYTLTYSSLNGNYDETEIVDDEEIDKTYDIVLTSSFTYLDGSTSEEVVNTIEDVTGKTLNNDKSTYNLGPISSDYNGVFNLNIKALDGEEVIYTTDLTYEANNISSGLTGKLNGSISPISEENGKGTYEVSEATTYMNTLSILGGELNPNSNYIVVYTDGTESAEMTAAELLAFVIEGSSIDLSSKLSGSYSINDSIQIKEVKDGEVVNTYAYDYEASIEYENEVDNDSIFSEMYERTFYDGYMVLSARNLYDEEGRILTVGDIVNGFTLDGEIEITDNEGNTVSLEDTEAELKNGYVLTFTCGETVSYEVIVFGDATDDNNFDKDDIEKVIESYLEEEKLVSMDLAVAEEEEELGVITFDDIALANMFFNQNYYEEYEENENLTLGLGDVPAEAYVGDKIEINVLVNSEEATEYINGIDGNLTLSDNLELSEVKVNDDQISSYKDNHFVVVSPSLKNGDVIVTLVFTATGEGEGTISLTGNMAKEADIYEFDELNASFNIIRNISSNSYLESLNADVGTFDKDFDKDVTEYTLTVPYDTQKVILSGALADIYSSVTGLTEYVLGGEKTVATITVTAEDGSTRTYIVNIVKEAAKPIVYYQSSDNYLKELSIDGYEIDFDKDVTEYKIDVKNNVDSLDIKAIANDWRSTVVITGNENFKVGENVVTITVTAENGSTKEYKIVVNKADKKKTIIDDDEKGSKIEKIIIIGLIVLVVLGLLYLIFKKDEEEINL